MYLLPLVDESRLVALISGGSATRPDWLADAACADIAVEFDPYFPEDEARPPASALDRCVGCPVAAECLATALVHEASDGFRVGWWGGYGPEDRHVLAERIGIRTEIVEREPTGPADLARILRAQNRTIPSIAAELGCTERTVYRYLASTAA